MSARAFAYLTVHSAKNRALSRIRRAKNPRYALAIVLGGTYLWLVYVRPGSGRSAPSGINTTGATWMVIGTAVLLVMTGIAWFLPNGPSSLALDKAESSFILPAPVTRRGLVGYKVVRAQLAILTTVLVWTVLMRRGGTPLALPLRAIGVWLFFTTTNLHRTGAEVVRAAWSIRGSGAMRRHWIATSAIVAIIIGLAVSLGIGFGPITAAWHVGPKAGIVAVSAAMRSGPALIVLWPIHAVLGPMVASTNREWLATLPAAVLVLAVHVIWVFRVDDEAVEVAVERATERLEMLRSRAGRSKVAGPSVRRRPDAVLRTMPLASTGWPAMAIVWKNILCMRRKTKSVVGVLAVVAMVPVLIGVLLVADGKEAPTATAISALAMCVLMIFTGPMLLRNDLRDDMLNLTALKLMPIHGRTIVAAEVLSVVVPLAMVEYFLVVLAGMMLLLAAGRPFGPVQTMAVLAGLLPAIVVLNGAVVGIQNAAPVLFPAWVKLGAITNGGIEAMGQMMIVVALFLVLLVAMLIVPAAIGTGLMFAFRAHLAAAIVGSLAIGTVLLGAEVAGLISLLGRTLERTEPGDVPTT